MFSSSSSQWTERKSSSKPSNWTAASESRWFADVKRTDSATSILGIGGHRLVNRPIQRWLCGRIWGWERARGIASSGLPTCWPSSSSSSISESSFSSTNLRTKNRWLSKRVTSLIGIRSATWLQTQPRLKPSCLITSGVKSKMIKRRAFTKKTNTLSSVSATNTTRKHKTWQK